MVIGSVTDGYNPQEEQFGNTRKLLEQLIGSDADILICTKSDLVVRDIDLLKNLGRVTVSWSINTLDENFKNDMDSASSIERRIAAMKQVYEAGIRTVCFVSPVFPGITDFEAIFERVKDQCDLFWLENLNLRGGFKKTIMDYIAGKYPDLVPLYDEIYNKHNRSYFEALEVKAEKMAKKYDCAFVDNEMPYGRVPQGHPVIVDYFYHEEIRGTENTGNGAQRYFRQGGAAAQVRESMCLAGRREFFFLFCFLFTFLLSFCIYESSLSTSRSRGGAWKGGGVSERGSSPTRARGHCAGRCTHSASATQKRKANFTAHHLLVKGAASISGFRSALCSRKNCR